MKKNVLALSITAALVGLGFAGGAHAIVTIPTGNASELRLSSDGIGNYLLVPYYSAQGTNNTMINIVNTDTQNGKAVKVRFRGAANSDDVFDFQVFMSPGDVWTASVSKNAAGLASLTTNDASCTKPAKATLNVTPFITARLDTVRRTGAALANETREGYVEIFNTADIPPTLARVDGTLTATANPLFKAIKHVDGVAPCDKSSGIGSVASAAAWAALDANLADGAAAAAAGLNFPTSGLMGDWVILNTIDAGAWSQRDVAIVATDAAGTPRTGNIVYFPQTGKLLGANTAWYTADPVLTTHPEMAAMYDAPDFSIPYVNMGGIGTTAAPKTQVGLLTGALATRSVYNEFLTSSTINATTDWVLSMPTRRYNAAIDYSLSTKVDQRIFTTGLTNYFDIDSTDEYDGQLCVLNMEPTYWSQEEDTKVDGVIVSPGTPTTVVFCGETNVVSINNGETASGSGLITSASGTLQATVARSALEPVYSAGWIQLKTPGISNRGLPIVGSAYLRATSGANTFGGTWEHKTDRVNK